MDLEANRGVADFYFFREAIDRRKAMNAAEHRRHPQIRRGYRPIRFYPLTTFYPLYSGGRDGINAITPVRPVRFQKVLPRYELSTSDTRDEGVGPMFNGIVKEISAGWDEPRRHRRPRPRRGKRAKGTSSRSDTLKRLKFGQIEVTHTSKVEMAVFVDTFV